MKSKKLTNRFFAVFAAVTFVLFTSCSSDSESAGNLSGLSNNEIDEIAEAPFSVVLKAFDAQGADVTTGGDVEGATLFVFNDQNDFVKQISVPKASLLNRQAIQISCAHTNKITVVAWGGLTSDKEDVPSLNEANVISDLQIQLKQNNGIAQIPGDLFYGQTVISRSSTKSGAQQEIKLERKVSSLSLATKNLAKKFGTDGVYQYKVRAINDGFDYQGNLIGEEVEYIFSASFDEKGNLVADTQPVLPSSKLVVELYKDNELIFSVSNDKKGEILSTKAGKQMNYIFNYSTKTKAELVVTPWNTVVQYVTVG
ncbi:FimB/Mfa2 family fimbrial subunit [Parabacteroides pacaensis]|uniref:FimB/Mfa2 family fimbrial subunit n=1 Tax=Parabacteroides pacaensis TaxID=2086575 RepID=UPI000D0F8D45|nr:FimB/Mfa2 family fimbrial subunit [Parabacteroides pacaensis]